MSILNTLRCDLAQNEYLIQKWQPSSGASNRQNQIRLGSSLRVRPGEAAVFFYTAKAGEQPLDIIRGPADLILETKNLPVLASIIGLAYGGDSPFQAELYFINLGQATQFKWGVEWFDAFDPRYPDFPVPVAASGTVTFSISDVDAFMRVQRLDQLKPADLARQVRPRIVAAVKASIVTLALAKGIPLVQLGSRIADVADSLAPKVRETLAAFGVTLSDFVIENIETDKTSTGFSDLMRVTRDQTRAHVETQGEVGRQNLRDSQVIQSGHLEQSLAIQREEMQRLQSLQTQTAYLNTHQINLQADVAREAAASLGKVGSGGGGHGGSDLGAAAIAIGMGGALGGVFASQIASTIPTRVGTTPGAVPPPPPPGATPPPPPPVHIARAGTVIGVFSRPELLHRVNDGTLSYRDSAWHEGMPGWIPLAQLLNPSAPPPPPPPPTA
jgi:membrane protease subunit (stomatin/prohibitin family)